MHKSMQALRESLVVAEPAKQANEDLSRTHLQLEQSKQTQSAGVKIGSNTSAPRPPCCQPGEVIPLRMLPRRHLTLLRRACEKSLSSRTRCA